MPVPTGGLGTCGPGLIIRVWGVRREVGMYNFLLLSWWWLGMISITPNQQPRTSHNPAW